jgi:hypothetical protein
MKNLLITGFTDTTSEVGEGGLTGESIVADACKAAALIVGQRIAQDKAKVNNHEKK